MAKETKQERIVRGMIDQVTEHLHELKSIASNPDSKELHVETWCQSVLKSCLGFTAVDGYSIRAQETRGKMRPDLVIYKDDKAICVVEVKKLGFNLDKSNLRSGKTQLAEYLHAIGSVNWGILSNGYEWRLYDFSSNLGTATDVLSFDLRAESGDLDLSKRNIEDLSWTLADLHESALDSKQWAEVSKEATAFSPESLARAILAADSVKYIAKAIRGEFDYRANTEVLFDKLRHLLEEGLDDAVDNWNEVKQAELNKYVSTQKRTVRKKRTSKPVELAQPTQPAPIPALAEVATSILDPKKVAA